VPEIAIALGSNVGDAIENIDRAVLALDEVFGLLAISHYYQTAPMYVEDQPAFVNAAVLTSTHQSPMVVLRTLKQLEVDLGREVRTRYGPREIDLDLVVYGRLNYRFASDHRVILQVPHSLARERRFVLAPLFDIAPNLHLPGFGNINELLSATNDQAESVVKLDHEVLPVPRRR
jgi:2-amino-4-hydroxy-6-hydroxymethyldihydropteridine diphosphokinase